MFEIHLRCEDEHLGQLLRLAHSISSLRELTPIEADAPPAQLPGPGKPLSMKKVRQLADARAARAAKRPLLRDQIMAEHAAALKNRRPINDIIFEALGQGPRQLSELRQLALAAGYGSSTASVTIRSLEMQKQVKRVSVGRYALPDDPTPAAELPALKPRNATGIDVMLIALRNGATRRPQLAVALGAAGFDPNGISARLNDAMQQGKIERTGPGTYKAKEPSDG